MSTISIAIHFVSILSILRSKQARIHTFKNHSSTWRKLKAAYRKNLATPLGNASACNCDVIVLSFKTPCNDAAAPRHISYLLDPKTTWISGRTSSSSLHSTEDPGYQYYIFLNDDTVLTFNKFTPPEMAATLQPFRVSKSGFSTMSRRLECWTTSSITAPKFISKKTEFMCITDTSLVCASGVFRRYS